MAPIKQIEITRFEIAMISKLFNEQYETHKPFVSAIKSNFQIFAIFKFQLAIDELLMSGCSAEVVLESIHGIWQEVDKARIMWNECISYIDPIRKMDPVINTFPIPMRKFHIKDTIQGLHYIEDESINIDPTNYIVYSNYAFVRHALHVCKRIEDIELQLEKKSDHDAKSREENLLAFFNDRTKMKICLDLFEELEITIGGKCQLTEGKGGKLFAVTRVIKYSIGLIKPDKPTLKQILNYFNDYLGTNFQEVNSRGKAYSKAQKEAEGILKKNGITIIYPTSTRL